MTVGVDYVPCRGNDLVDIAFLSSDQQYTDPNLSEFLRSCIYLLWRLYASSTRSTYEVVRIRCSRSLQFSFTRKAKCHGVKKVRFQLSTSIKNYEYGENSEQTSRGKKSQSKLTVLVEGMTDSKKLDSLETIQTNCVWIISQSDSSIVQKMRFVNQ